MYCPDTPNHPVGYTLGYLEWCDFFLSLPPMDSLGLPSDVCITYVIWMFGIGGRKYLWYKQFTGHGGSCAVYLEKWLASAMSRVDKVRLIFTLHSFFHYKPPVISLIEKD